MRSFLPSKRRQASPSWRALRAHARGHRPSCNTARPCHCAPARRACCSCAACSSLCYLLITVPAYPSACRTDARLPPPGPRRLACDKYRRPASAAGVITRSRLIITNCDVLAVPTAQFWWHSLPCPGCRRCPVLAVAAALPYLSRESSRVMAVAGARATLPCGPDRTWQPVRAESAPRQPSGPDRPRQPLRAGSTPATSDGTAYAQPVP